MDGCTHICVTATGPPTLSELARSVGVMNVWIFVATSGARVTWSNEMTWRFATLVLFDALVRDSLSSYRSPLCTNSIVAWVASDRVPDEPPDHVGRARPHCSRTSTSAGVSHANITPRRFSSSMQNRTMRLSNSMPPNWRSPDAVLTPKRPSAMPNNEVILVLQT